MLPWRRNRWLAPGVVALEHAAGAARPGRGGLHATSRRACTPSALPTNTSVAVQRGRGLDPAGGERAAIQDAAARGPADTGSRPSRRRARASPAATGEDTTGPRVAVSKRDRARGRSRPWRWPSWQPRTASPAGQAGRRIDGVAQRAAPRLACRPRRAARPARPSKSATMASSPATAGVARTLAPIFARPDQRPLSRPRRRGATRRRCPRARAAPASAGEENTRAQLARPERACPSRRGRPARPRPCASTVPTITRPSAAAATSAPAGRPSRDSARGPWPTSIADQRAVVGAGVDRRPRPARASDSTAEPMATLVQQAPARAVEEEEPAVGGGDHHDVPGDDGRRDHGARWRRHSGAQRAPAAGAGRAPVRPGSPRKSGQDGRAGGGGSGRDRSAPRRFRRGRVALGAARRGEGGQDRAPPHRRELRRRRAVEAPGGTAGGPSASALRRRRAGRGPRSRRRRRLRRSRRGDPSTIRIASGSRTGWRAASRRGRAPARARGRGRARTPVPRAAAP